MPSLPFRPLDVRGHGVYDPEKKVFYPFKTQNVTLPAKVGVRRYIRSVTIAYSATGILAVGYSRVQYVQEGATRYFQINSPSMTLADDFTNHAVSNILDILTDSDTPVTVANSVVTGLYSIIYAEIYDDDISEGAHT